MDSKHVGLKIIATTWLRRPVNDIGPLLGRDLWSPSSSRVSCFPLFPRVSVSRASRVRFKYCRNGLDIMRKNHRAALRDIAMRNRHPVDMIRAAAVAGIDARFVVDHLGWSVDFFERCCIRNHIVFGKGASQQLSEPADVILEHILIGLGVEEQFAIASYVAKHLGYELRHKPANKESLSRAAVAQKAVNSLLGFQRASP